MAQAEVLSSRQQVSSLIRDPLNNTESFDYVYPKNRRWMVGTHGTHLGQVINLARHGKFFGGEPGLMGDFFLNANVNYAKWHETELAEELKNPDFEDVDFFQQAIYYAQSAERDRSEYIPEIDGAKFSDREGIVFAFSKKVLEISGVRFNCSDDEDYSPELILPFAPAIDTISGIYPVRREDLASINKVLENL